ncbi:hypothetical protein LRAMOSA08287 [Lichtheimia ramosa]|uniref:Major facilitator superfamily (MFS) profile domain-containing protein n=1 Tax=Lichtheimia ramosa TaxID=688394 RepID=A0A077WF37_9FUNG|nr:hypothetical protein LRAMOSA08287 [Lichtheimia ramosa]
MAAITTTKQQDSSGNTSLSTTESFQEKTKIHNDDVPPLTPSEWRKLRWRLDLRIVLVFALIYMWSAMDRSNIGNAKLGNILEDLDIPDATYNVGMSIFFIGYIIFQVPSNLVLKKIGANLWMSFLVTFTGIIVACSAAIKNGAGLLAVRFFLGIAETGVFPCSVYYFSIWYTRREQGKRFSIYYASAAIAGAVGGLLAYGIMRMDGMRGMHGWQWLFLLEALPTIILGIATFFILPGFPSTSKALNERERASLMKRLETDWTAAGVVEDDTKSPMSEIRAAFTDWKMYHMAFTCFFGSSVFYGLTLFLPSIVRNMGFENLEAQAMTVPPYVIACIFMIVLGTDADRRGERGFHVAGSSFFGMLGFILLAACHDKGPVALYIFTCMAVAGAYSQFSVFITWASNNFGGRTKRAIATAFISAGGNIGGAVAGQIYRANDAPQYIRAHSTCAAFLCCHVILVLIMKYMLNRINKQRANMSIEKYDEACKRYEQTSDWHPDFRYIT